MDVKRVRRLMHEMGLMPIHQRPRISALSLGHKIYPYLLRKIVIDRSNQTSLSPKSVLPPPGQGEQRSHLHPIGPSPVPHFVAIVGRWSRKALT